MTIMRNVSVPFGAPYGESLVGNATGRFAPRQLGF